MIYLQISTETIYLLNLCIKYRLKLQKEILIRKKKGKSSTSVRNLFKLNKNYNVIDLSSQKSSVDIYDYDDCDYKHLSETHQGARIYK